MGGAQGAWNLGGHSEFNFMQGSSVAGWSGWCVTVHQMVLSVATVMEWVMQELYVEVRGYGTGQS